MDCRKVSLESINLHKDCEDDTIMISVDPGVKNTAVVIVKTCPHKETAEILWCSMYNMYATPGVNPELGLSKTMSDEIVAMCATYKPDLAVVEYQPPVSKCRSIPTIRYNSWIEGYFCALFSGMGLNVVRVSPVAVKAYFSIHEASYHKTKTRVIAIAKEMVSPIGKMNDHVADCIINSIYAIKPK